MTGWKLCSLERKRPVLNVPNGLAQRNTSSKKIDRKALVTIQGLKIRTPNRSWHRQEREDSGEGEPQNLKLSGDRK